MGRNQIGKALIVTDQYSPAIGDTTPNDLPFVLESSEEFPAARRVELRYVWQKGSKPTRRHHRMRVGASHRALSTDTNHWNSFPLSQKHGYNNLRTVFQVECHIGIGGVDHPER